MREQFVSTEYVRIEKKIYEKFVDEYTGCLT